MSARIKKGILLFFVISYIIFLRQFPNYYAGLKTPSGYVYSGQASWFDPWDINLYVGAIRYGQEKHLTLINQYTTEDAGQTVMYPLYTSVGYVFPYVDPYVLFHTTATVVGILICLSLFFLCNLFFHNYLYSLIAMYLISIGGGLGWLFYGKTDSADLFVTSFTFASSFQRAHEGIGTMLRICAIVCHFFFLETNNRTYAFLSFICLLLIILFYPYYIFSYAIVAGILTLLYFFKKRNIEYIFFLVSKLIVVSTIAGGYYIYLKQSGFGDALSENLSKVGLIPLLSGYGNFILLFLVLPFMKKVRRGKSLYLFLLIWIGVSILLSYLPLDFSRFYLRGLFFPLVILSVLLIKNIVSILNRRIVIVLFIISMSFTSLFRFYQRIAATNENNPWFYLSDDVQHAMDFLQKSDKDGVFSFYTFSNFVPAKTDKRVYFGHLSQTPDAETKIHLISVFYKGMMTDAQALDFLYHNHIAFVVYTPIEEQMGGHVYPFLKKEYENETIKIFTME
jgi:hypothetical protein